MRQEGIDPNAFAELLTSSGLILCDDITWISFSRSVPCAPAPLFLWRADGAGRRARHLTTPHPWPAPLPPPRRNARLPCSGSDFAYLLKVLTGEPLPYSEKEFDELLGIFFPNVYDIKSLMKSVKTLKGGLQEVGDTLQVWTRERRPRGTGRAQATVSPARHLSYPLPLCRCRASACSTRQAAIPS